MKCDTIFSGKNMINIINLLSMDLPSVNVAI